MGSASSSEKPRPKSNKSVVVLLHVRKCAGTKLVKELSSVFRLPKGEISNGNLLEAKTRLPLCWWREDLDQLRKRRAFKRADLLCAEWDFFRVIPDEVVLVTCLRDPLERLRSEYRARGGDTAFGSVQQFYGDPWVYPWGNTHATGYREYITCPRMANWLTRLLNGYGARPDKELTEAHLLRALERLERFHIIIILEYPWSFSFLQELGVYSDAKVVHNATADSRLFDGTFENSASTEEFASQFREENSFDYAVYDRAKELCIERGRKQGLC